MNFREKFEDWHQRTYTYIVHAVKGSTALNTRYPGPCAQQYRWEGWQACSSQAFEDGHAKGLADAKSVQEGWLRAVDEALVGLHLGVADASDTYEQAKTKLNTLICWSIQVEKDLSTPWVSVKDKLPECNKPGQDCSFSKKVLVSFGADFFGDPQVAVAFLLDRNDGYGPMWVGHSGSHNDVTDWMEIRKLGE